MSTTPSIPHASRKMTLPPEIEKKLETEIRDPQFREAIGHLLEALEPWARRWIVKEFNQADSIHIATEYEGNENWFFGSFLKKVTRTYSRVAWLCGYKLDPNMSDTDAVLVELFRRVGLYQYITAPTFRQTYEALVDMKKICELSGANEMANKYHEAMLKMLEAERQQEKLEPEPELKLPIDYDLSLSEREGI